jgi:hypothetical protein
MPAIDVSEAILGWKSKIDDYRLYRDYHRGRHQMNFATSDFIAKYGWVLQNARENLCPAVVSAFTDRLSIQSWGESDAIDEGLEQGLSRLLNLQNREAFRCGDSYALVWPGADGTPKPRYHRADEGWPKVSDTDPDVLEWWAKIWWDKTLQAARVNIYYADRVERYRSKMRLALVEGRIPAENYPDDPDAWEPHRDDDGPDTIGHTFGAVPACWWKRDADDQKSHGHSVLHDVIPLQDGLNKAVADMIVNSESFSRPIRYLLQYAAEARLNPETGQMEHPKLKFDPTKQQILAVNGAGPMGQLDPPDVTKVIAVQDAFALKIARVVGIPAYYLSQTSGDVPSGESLRVLSSRLISAVTDFQQDSTPVWHGLMQLLGHDVWPEWAPAMQLDQIEQMQVAREKQDLGYPLEDILRDLGEDDVAGILDRARDEQANVGQTAVDAFRNGQDPANLLR